jgi:N-acetylmuramoyl-L-alanine amidase
MMDISSKYHCRIENYRPGGNSDAYIVVHNTGSTATAEQEAKNLANNVQKPSRSFHYVLDGSECYQVVDDTDTAWSVGAWKGCTAYVRNNQSINVEVCSDGAEFTDAEKQQLRELVSMLMQRHNIGAGRVVRHWDCHSGRKDCPAYYAGDGNAAWNELHAYITGDSDEMPTYTGGSSTAPEPEQPSGAIAEVQSWLGCSADGIYGPDTKRHLVRRLQQELNAQFGAGLADDGYWGPKTRAACVNVRRGASGNITKVLQGALICHGYNTGGFDGVFGGKTYDAVRSYQSDHGLSDDGVAGKGTFSSLLG